MVQTSYALMKIKFISENEISTRIEDEARAIARAECGGAQKRKTSKASTFAKSNGAEVLADPEI